MLTVATSPVRKEQAEVYRIVDAYIATFPRMFTEGERIKSLYLFSESPGTGKTTTACAIANEYLTVHYVGSIARGLRPLDRPIYFLDVNEWQTLYNEFNRPRVPDHIAEPAADKYYRMMQYAKDTPFAILDDIGVRECSEGFRGDLHSVINHRVTNGKATVYTSNVPMAELPEIFGEQRLYDRIRDMTMELCFVGESKRGFRR